MSGATKFVPTKTRRFGPSPTDRIETLMLSPERLGRADTEADAGGRSRGEAPLPAADPNPDGPAQRSALSATSVELQLSQVT